MGDDMRSVIFLICFSMEVFEGVFLVEVLNFVYNVV